MFRLTPITLSHCEYPPSCIHNFYTGDNIAASQPETPIYDHTFYIHVPLPFLLVVIIIILVVIIVIIIRKSRKIITPFKKILGEIGNRRIIERQPQKEQGRGQPKTVDRSPFRTCGVQIRLL
jgi:hypothetical protein